MNKTYLKFLKRSIWRTKARFFAILAIVAIGVGFLGGLSSATPDMRLTLDTYYDKYKVHDINIKSPLGLSEGDIKALSEMEGVESLTPAYVTDLVMENQSGAYVARLYGMPLGDEAVNGSKLIEGRLPEKPGEALLCASNSYALSFALGDSFSISKTNKDYDSLGDTYAFTELTAVGIVDSPLHFAHTEEPSTVGSGSVQLIMFLPPESYSLSVYTDAFLRISGAEELDTFSKEYESLSAEYLAKTEELGVSQAQIRYDELIAEAQNELEDGKKEYEDGKKEAKEELDKAKKKLEDAKKDIAEGKKELAEGKTALEDATLQLADGEEQYSEGRQKLIDGETKLEEGKSKLEDSRQSLNSAQAQLNSSIKEKIEEFKASVPGLVEEQINKLNAQIDEAEAKAQAKLDSSEKELAAGEAAIKEAKLQLAQKEEELAAGKAQLEAAWAEYNQNSQALADGRAQLEAAKAGFTGEIAAKREQLEAAKDQLTEEEYQVALAQIASAEVAGLGEFSQKFAALEEQEAALSSAAEQLNAKDSELQAADSALQAAKVQLSEKEAQLAAGKQELAAGREQLKAEIAANRKELENSRPQIRAAIEEQGYGAIESARASAQNEIDAGLAQLAEGEQSLKSSQQEINRGWQELSDSRVQLDEATATIEENRQKLKDAQKEITDGEKELLDGEKTYEEEKLKAEKELADAKNKLDEGQSDIAAIKPQEWLVFDRDDILSFSSYEGDSGKVEAISAIFPAFFFLVAALVALTTMTRLVEEERGQIGVFKALGYSNGVIIFYYLGYSILASLIGSIFGIVLGSYTLPVVIASAYSMNYNAPELITKFWWFKSIMIIVVAMVCTTVAAWAASMHQLRDKPSNLMQPKAPQAGKRILLERIGPLWKRFSFTQKITARNLFRYKKRLIMTVFGIAGCSALLVTGFGLRDSIRDIGRKQFGEIYTYDVSIMLKEDSNPKEEELSALLNSQDYISNYAEIHTENGYSGEKSFTILVPESEEALVKQMNLRNMATQKQLEFGPQSVILTQKLSESLGLSPGDSFTIKNADAQKAQLTVSGIAENYVQDYVYIGTGIYSASFGKPAAYNQIFATMAGDDQELRDSLAREMLTKEPVQLVLFNHDIESTFNDTVKNIDAIVMVLIGSAGALAMIVVYNLTNINICERKKELATIKVLGFHQSELAGYIYRETTLLCVLGIVAGCVLGIFLHSFVVSNAEMDAVMFGRSIYPMSYVLSAAVTLGFTALVDIIMLKKLRGIDMVESMKANE